MKINFQKMNGLIPVIVQDSKTNEVYMLGFMNEEAFRKTKEMGFVTFWSRSRNMLWTKGEVSGNRLKVEEIFVDCDKDTLLIKAQLMGKNICHTGNKSCFYTPITNL